MTFLPLPPFAAARRGQQRKARCPERAGHVRRQKGVQSGNAASFAIVARQTALTAPGADAPGQTESVEP